MTPEELKLACCAAIGFLVTALVAVSIVFYYEMKQKDAIIEKKEDRIKDCLVEHCGWHDMYIKGVRCPVPPDPHSKR